MSLLDFLQDPAFTLLGVPTSRAEVFGFLSGALCVFGVARQRLWSWPVGILNNAFFMLLFAWSRLYADAALQVIFAVLGAWGWYVWLRGGPGHGALRVRCTRRVEWFALGSLSCLCTAGVAFWLRTWTDSPLPFWDALILVLSLVATYGQARKLLESWWIWIVVDVVSIPVYLSRDLVVTALLYLVFLVICVFGLRSWRHTFDEALLSAETT